ncbi:MAG: Mrp/NBP35 family ATP-binding protein [Bacteroidales bacterium]|jgi:ATP-binding protein involved in chromosome partitioning|nr:Mrp/NBP35 family ATP-binding protein [Bacteroidales bacterium]
MFSVDKISEILSTIIHPGAGSDIVSLGMVGNIASDENGISILLTPEKPTDPFMSSIRSVIVRKLKDTLGYDVAINEITVEPRAAAVVQQEDKPEPVLSAVRNIIAVSSGKGGVGKTTVAVNLAVALSSMGFSVGLLDADVFGPSVPKMFNAETYRPEIYRKGDTDVIAPMIKYGIKVLSAGFFVSPGDAVIWRGPMASNFLKQLIAQGDWGQLDYLLIDLPPGTSDIHITIVQEVKVTGAIVVTTPQQVALADAVKGISMFNSDRINVRVLGLVENMSWFTPAELPDNRYYIFGRDGGKELAEKAGIPLLGQIPIVQSICEGGDSGKPVALNETATGQAFAALAAKLIETIDKPYK